MNAAAGEELGLHTLLYVLPEIFSAEEEDTAHGQSGLYLLVWPCGLALK